MGLSYIPRTAMGVRAAALAHELFHSAGGHQVAIDAFTVMTRRAREHLRLPLHTPYAEVYKDLVLREVDNEADYSEDEREEVLDLLLQYLAYRSCPRPANNN